MNKKIRAFVFVLLISALFTAPGFAAEEESSEVEEDFYKVCAFVDSPPDLARNPALYQKTALCVFSNQVAIKGIFLLIMLIYLFFEPLFADLILESPIILGFDLLGILISILSAIFLWTLGPLRWALVFLSNTGTGIYLSIAVILVFANIIRTRTKRAEIAQEEPVIR